jgi:hypothetical protein
MSNDTNKPIDMAEHAIVRQAQMLDKEIQPEVDLWPKISQKIKNTPQESFPKKSQQSWMPMAMAASLMIAVGALGFAGYTSYSVQQPVGYKLAESSTISLIEQPYMVAKTGYLQSLATEENHMSPEVRAVLKKNLKIIDDATKEILSALNKNPNDPFLTQALLETRQKELNLLSQVTNHDQDTI